MITNETKPINIGTRLTTMILDHFFMSIIAMVFFIPYFILQFSEIFDISHTQSDFNFMGGPTIYIGLFGLALYFCKDCINGRSLAKPILKKETYQ